MDFNQLAYAAFHSSENPSVILPQYVDEWVKTGREPVRDKAASWIIQWVVCAKWLPLLMDQGFASVPSSTHQRVEEPGGRRQSPPKNQNPTTVQDLPPRTPRLQPLPFRRVSTTAPEVASQFSLHRRLQLAPLSHLRAWLQTARRPPSPMLPVLAPSPRPPTRRPSTMPAPGTCDRQTPLAPSATPHSGTPSHRGCFLTPSVPFSSPKGARAAWCGLSRHFHREFSTDTHRAWAGHSKRSSRLHVTSSLRTILPKTGGSTPRVESSASDLLSTARYIASSSLQRRMMLALGLHQTFKRVRVRRWRGRLHT